MFERLRSSAAHWQIVAQQIPFAPVDREAGPGVAFHMDKWAGYPAARERLLDVIAARGRHDTVLLTGDNHNHWVMELRRASDRPEAAPVAHEFLGTSISSTGDGAEQRDTYANILSENPHARYLNSRRGYVRCTVTRREWRAGLSRAALRLASRRAHRHGRHLRSRTWTAADHACLTSMPATHQAAAAARDAEQDVDCLRLRL